MKGREENLTLFAPLTPRQYHVLEWFFKEVAKAVFLEILALVFVPSVINSIDQPSPWIIAGGLIFSLTSLMTAVILAAKGKQ